MIKNIFNKSNLFLGAVAIIGFSLVIIFDIVYWKIPLLGDVEAPIWSRETIVRSIILLILTSAGLFAIPDKRDVSLNFKSFKKIQFEMLLVLIVLTGAAFNLFLWIALPEKFSYLCLEDGIIESGSAILLFSGALFSFLIFNKLRKDSKESKEIKLALLFLAILLFLIAMEEVSWFQRQLKVGVSNYEFFKKNDQLEMNIHNFYTIAFEYIYYTGTFLFFVFLPYLYMIYPKYSNQRFLRIFIARPYIIIIGTIASVYNYEKWDSLLTQVAVFASVFILIKLSRSFNITKTEKNILRWYILLIVISQLLFLINGTKFVRYWEVTEYKEFYIAILLFLYPISIWTQLNQESQKTLIS